MVISALGVVTQLEASDKVLYAAAPSERGAFHVGSGAGTYNYGYNTGDGIAKVEVRRPDGSVVGSYRYFDAQGKQVVRSYIADEKGFRVLGNDLPISPETQATAIDGLPAFTAAVEGDTKFSNPTIGASGSLLSTVQEESNNVVNTQQIQTNQESDVLSKHETLLKQQQELILKQQKELEKLKQQYNQYLQDFQQKSTKPSLPSSKLPSFTQAVPNVLSPYLLLPNRVNYDFPAGFAYKGAPKIKKPIGVKGEFETMIDYAAGHAPSAGHLHEPVGPHKETHDYYNPVTAGHTRSHQGRRRHYIIGHAR